jgi:predicted ATPase
MVPSGGMQSRPNRARWAEAEMHRVQETLLLTKNEHVAADESYQRALAVARHHNQSAKFRELRAALDLAALWRDQGKRTEACDLLAPDLRLVHRRFRPVLKDAKSLLDELM